MSTYNLGTVVIVWVLMMHGILAVATRVDSYLNTLGLSAAQTGRGLAGAMVAAAMGVQRTVSSAKNVAGKTIGMAKGAKNLATKGAGAIRQRVADKHAQFDESGHAKTSTFANVMNQNLNKGELDKLEGYKGGESFIKNTDLNGTTLGGNFDKTTFKANEDGTLSMQWTDDKTGKTAEVTMSSLDPDMKGHTNIDPNTTQGRVITMTGENGEQMKLFAAATGDGAAAFNTANPAMEKKMAEFNKQEGCSAKEVAPGVWQTQRVDSNGNVVEAKEYSSTQMYNSDPALNSSTEQIGDMSYNVSDITAATTGPALSSASDPAHDFQAFQQMGDVTASKDYGNGRFDVTINGKEYSVGAAAMWNVSENAQNVQRIQASNGSVYNMMPKNQAETFMPNSRKVTLDSNGRAKGVFATPKLTAASSAPAPVNKPKMYQAAQNRVNGNK